MVTQTHQIQLTSPRTRRAEAIRPGAAKAYDFGCNVPTRPLRRTPHTASHERDGLGFVPELFVPELFVPGLFVPKLFVPGLLARYSFRDCSSSGAATLYTATHFHTRHHTRENFATPATELLASWSLVPPAAHVTAAHHHPLRDFPISTSLIIISPY